MILSLDFLDLGSWVSHTFLIHTSLAKYQKITSLYLDPKSSNCFASKLIIILSVYAPYQHGHHTIFQTVRILLAFLFNDNFSAFRLVVQKDLLLVGSYFPGLKDKDALTVRGQLAQEVNWPRR